MDDVAVGGAVVTTMADVRGVLGRTGCGRSTGVDPTVDDVATALWTTW